MRRLNITREADGYVIRELRRDRGIGWPITTIRFPTLTAARHHLAFYVGVACLQQADHYGATHDWSGPGDRKRLWYFFPDFDELEDVA